MILPALFAGALASASGASEAAAVKKLEPAFSGTIVTVYPDGRKGHLLLDRDRTYRYTGRSGGKSSGVWNLDDDGARVCLRQRAPVAIPFHYCTAIPSGRSWTAKAQTGEPLKVHLQPGRAS